MEERRDSGRYLGGLILVGLGFLFLLSNFGIFSWNLVGRWWPLILIGIGLIILLRRSEGQLVADRPAPAPGGGMMAEPPTGASVERRREYPTGAIILIGLGLAFLLSDVIGGKAFPALVLIAIGGALLLRDWNRRGR